ncbi:MAG: response regulator transcription factor, partial [Bacteroidetes bacterium]|nr:response regulator transcription factor [Bacteroidota bacterium]
MKKIRLLITEDHNLVRQGIENLLSQCDDISVVAEAEDGQTMINKYLDFKPDVVLCDIEMPRMDGLTAANRILTKDNKAKIIFLTIHNTEEYIYNAYKIGAVGLIPKIVLKDELIDSIRAVASGKKYFIGKTEEDLKSRYLLI